jgi:hypothetical protein
MGEAPVLTDQQRNRETGVEAARCLREEPAEAY